MEEVAGARHGAVEGSGVAHIALDDLQIEAGEIVPRALGAHQSADLMARRDQGAGHRRADEAAGAGDEGACLPFPLAPERGRGPG